MSHRPFLTNQTATVIWGQPSCVISPLTTLATCWSLWWFSVMCICKSDGGSWHLWGWTERKDMWWYLTGSCHECVVNERKTLWMVKLLRWAVIGTGQKNKASPSGLCNSSSSQLPAVIRQRMFMWFKGRALTGAQTGGGRGRGAVGSAQCNLLLQTYQDCSTSSVLYLQTQYTVLYGTWLLKLALKVQAEMIFFYQNPWPSQICIMCPLWGTLVPLSV